MKNGSRILIMFIILFFIFSCNKDEVRKFEYKNDCKECIVILGNGDTVNYNSPRIEDKSYCYYIGYLQKYANWEIKVICPD